MKKATKLNVPETSPELQDGELQQESPDTNVNSEAGSDPDEETEQEQNDGLDTQNQFVVTLDFQDAPEFQDGELQRYKRGDDVSHFPPDRLTSLLARGIVSKK